MVWSCRRSLGRHRVLLAVIRYTDIVPILLVVAHYVGAMFSRRRSPHRHCVLLVVVRYVEVAVPSSSRDSTGVSIPRRRYGYVGNGL